METLSTLGAAETGLCKNEDPKPSALTTESPALANTPVHSAEAAASAVPAQVPAKEAQKPSPRKPKKRKPKVPRDVDAPRQPLTGIF